ncbi:GntR family transcriptional regulator YhfZ [Clostridium amazonitimonense]|uniref:GntR family transcriptional regulator YhfZ n=1 Tax=Clostridium amazonitimonense TaxID=1499689 RepID=UPI000509CD56|nr:GntR family transcriptional regulator YhfZ [Clostridium amazonitimonense]
MDLKAKLMQKNGYMAMTLAKEFIAKDIEDRIETIANLAEKHNTARGTIQSALKFLQEYKAICLESRGHLGTFITYIDYGKLLEVADTRTILGVMPLPYSKRYEGLATGIHNSSFAERFPLNLAYMRGAKNRLEALEEGRYDFAVMSCLAAEHYIKHGEPIIIAMNFGSNSFVDNHIMAFNNSCQCEIKDGMRVGVDTSSLDHEIMTVKECEGKKVELVHLLYSQIISNLIKGKIDAAICTIDEVKDKHLDVKYKITSGEYSDKNTEAVLVINKEREEMGKLISKFLKKEEVLKYQNQVIEEKIIPNY